MNGEGTGPLRPASDALVSVVVPVYNEADQLTELHRQTAVALAACGCRGEFVFVNDGSTDSSGRVLDDLARSHRDVRVLHLSRNFGQQACIQAGLEHARGEAVVVMDADFQDHPAHLGCLIEKWRDGYDVVYAIRVGREEAAFKRFLFFAFYRILRAVSDIPIPCDAGNFGLVDQRIVRLITRIEDRHRYFAGLRSWVGYRQIGIPMKRGARYDGRPRTSLRGLVRLARSALVSFSGFPLTVFYGIAVVSMLVFAGISGFALYHKLFTGLAIPGWASPLITASFFGAINALGIALLGEYVVRIYDQVRGRPLYLIERTTNIADEPVRAGEQPGPDSPSSLPLRSPRSTSSEGVAAATGNSAGPPPALQDRPAFHSDRHLE